MNTLTIKSIEAIDDGCIFRPRAEACFEKF